MGIKSELSAGVDMNRGAFSLASSKPLNLLVPSGDLKFVVGHTLAIRWRRSEKCARISLNGWTLSKLSKASCH